MCLQIKDDKDKKKYSAELKKNAMNKIFSSREKLINEMRLADEQATACK